MGAEGWPKFETKGPPLFFPGRGFATEEFQATWVEAFNAGVKADREAVAGQLRREGVDIADPAIVELRDGPLVPGSPADNGNRHFLGLEPQALEEAL